ncbi:hypothetical protein JOC85_002682 [Bacillus mesophilus]|uniref:Glycosyl-4,4'-diaponeurosporenoate acyltransferase n=1 Tax=Bacillus mesophilus TaxID=1808955 RepID=A0A6M0Q900_9BACI|nr:hypothetical protein [Bacillus mesophilus]NEY72763.1 hypothetical protein [Bacillus mesophilus]
MFRLCGVWFFKRLIIFLVNNLYRLIYRKELPKRPNNYILWSLSADGLRGFEKYTRKNEGVHVFLQFILVFMLSLNIYDQNEIKIIYYVLIIIINTQAILLQRYNRNRIYKILTKKFGKINLTQQQGEMDEGKELSY